MAFTATDLSASTLELDVAALLLAADPPAVIGLLLFEEALFVLLVSSATPTIVLSAASMKNIRTCLMKMLQCGRYEPQRACMK